MNDEERFDVLEPDFADFAGDEAGRAADSNFTDRFPIEASSRTVAA